MAVNVLPIIDLQTGRLQFPLDGVWTSFFVADPRRLSQLLARTVRTPSFDVTREELWVYIAQRGQYRGVAQVFSLAKFPAASSLTKLSS